MKEWRQRSLEDSITREQRWATEQLQAVLNWLETEVQTQKVKLDWLNARSHEGTSAWITKHPKFRSWLQRGRGSPILWMYGKPGSGQSSITNHVTRPDPLHMLTYIARKIGSAIQGGIIHLYRPTEKNLVLLLRLPDLTL